MRIVFSFLSIGSFLLLWFFLVNFEVIRFADPIRSFQSFFYFIINEDPVTGMTIIEHSLVSLRIVFLGVGAALLLGVSLGVIMGRYRLFYNLFEPILEILRPIPGVAWFPVAIIFFGGGGSVFIVFICSFFQILINTIFGVHSVDKNIIDVAKILKAKERDIIVKIILPSSFSYIVNGTRMGIGTGFLGLISAEMISFSSAGIGFFILTMHSIGHIEKMVAGMMMVALMGFSINKLLLKVGKVHKESYA